MKKLISRLSIFCVVIFLAITFASCSTTKSSDQKSVKEQLAELRATKKYDEKKIKIGDNFYEDKEAKVEAGTIVIWENKGNVIHDVMADKPNDKNMDDFSSDTLHSGDIHVALFEEPGTYYYHCHFHGGPKRGQWGSITVTSGSS